MSEDVNDLMSAGESRERGHRKKPPSDTEEVPHNLQIMHGPELDRYRIKQLERSVFDIEQRLDSGDRDFTDMKIWRGYILGAIAAASFILGLVISVLGMGWFQWKK